MTVLSGDLLVDHELTSFVEWVYLLTGHRVVAAPGMGGAGVEIDHDNRVIRINSLLNPPAFRWALSRACRRITQGSLACPEFHAKLRLVTEG